MCISNIYNRKVITGCKELKVIAAFVVVGGTPQHAVSVRIGAKDAGDVAAPAVLGHPFQCQRKWKGDIGVGRHQDHLRDVCVTGLPETGNDVRSCEVR
jgi:hypothetical protein